MTSSNDHAWNTCHSSPAYTNTIITESLPSLSWLSLIAQKVKSEGLASDCTTSWLDNQPLFLIFHTSSSGAKRHRSNENGFSMFHHRKTQKKNTEKKQTQQSQHGGMFIAKQRNSNVFVLEHMCLSLMVSLCVVWYCCVCYDEIHLQVDGLPPRWSAFRDHNPWCDFLLLDDATAAVGMRNPFARWSSQCHTQTEEVMNAQRPEFQSVWLRWWIFVGNTHFVGQCFAVICLSDTPPTAKYN